MNAGKTTTFRGSRGLGCLAFRGSDHRGETRMTRFRAIALLSAVLVLGTAAAPDANAQSAAVEGVARSEDGSVPVPFALVRLVPVDSTASRSGTPPQGITSADGRYRFSGVAAGRYRVQLLRIG